MSFSADDLRAAVAELPPLPDERSFWQDRQHEVRRRIIDEGPADFLTWPTITSTMFVGKAPYIEAERAALSHRWAEAAETTNEVHQAYHIARWEAATGRDVRTLRRIVEFGGGYGALAMVLRRAGFTGDYVIIDLPEFALLQRYVLSREGVEGVRWAVKPPASADLFIGLWSLNEADQATQRRIGAGLRAPLALLGYQDAAPPLILGDQRWAWAVVPGPVSCTSYAYGEAA